MGGGSFGQPRLEFDVIASRQFELVRHDGIPSQAHDPVDVGTAVSERPSDTAQGLSRELRSNDCHGVQGGRVRRFLVLHDLEVDGETLFPTVEQHILEHRRALGHVDENIERQSGSHHDLFHVEDLGAGFCEYPEQSGRDSGMVRACQSHQDGAAIVHAARVNPRDVLPGSAGRWSLSCEDASVESGTTRRLRWRFAGWSEGSWKTAVPARACMTHPA